MLTKFIDRLRRRYRRRQGFAECVESVDNVKTFAGALEQFNDKLKSGVPFSLVRFGDGEMKIIQGELIDLSSKYNGEHKYVPGQPDGEEQRVLLSESLHFRHEQYYVGIACPCCVGMDNFSALKEASAQPESQLTWANIFVNANYRTFLETTTPLLAHRRIALVCHHQANTDGLPFQVEQRFSTGANAWIKDHQRLSQEMSAFLTELETNGRSESWVFLFCAGVLSNILVKELTEKFPRHTYIDAGSVYDSMLGLGKTRKYLKGSKNLKKVCVWG